MTAKQAILEMAQSVPDDIDWEEAHYQLFLRQRIQECKTAKAFTLEEAKAKVSSGFFDF